ncbi:RlpA-like protein precursor [bacterium BMS3Abin09]|nr:RlpA-like protein precursor [bacterium BMS3Abin09]
MKRLLIIIVGLVFLVSCGKTHRLPLPDYKYKKGSQYMTASWYGVPFHGRQTACGERYDMYGLTAAHKTMKFGTKLRVTNPDTNESVVVTITDRGPFIKGRDLDLSYGAAKKIGHLKKGVGRVWIKYLGRDMRYVKRVPFIKPGISAALTIQVGSFSEQENANRLKQGLEINYNNVYITTIQLEGKKFYRVRVGKFNSSDSAYSIAEKLADEGYTVFITSRD